MQNSGITMIRADRFRFCTILLWW